MTAYNEVWMGLLKESPLGSVWVAAAEKGVVAVSLWDDLELFVEDVVRLTGTAPVLDQERVSAEVAQLSEYFAGKRREFELRIDWSVLTPFQRTALRVVYAIPYGRLSTYGDIAREIGQPNAVRAVGRANATNPIPIIIPCHRVLGADGKLTGYGAPGGLETKAWLLRMEGSWLI